MFLLKIYLTNYIYYYRGYKLDKERFNAIYIHQKYNVSNRGRDKSLISRNILSNKRKGIVNCYLFTYFF